MRIVLSRKGFDSTSGGGPSPIVGGRPLSLPIPATEHSRTTYGSLGLGEHAARASRGRFGADDLCHHDPMFLPDGTCLFGQCGAAQTHLANRGIGAGDVFLFFGLFRDEETGEPHHRIFGYLEVARRIDLARCDAATLAGLRDRGHPHAIAMHGRNDAIYRGRGRAAAGAPELLRLTVPGGPPSLWRRPEWLRRGGLSYHDRADRWLRGGQLRAVSRGQEFVADVGRRKAPREWLARVIAAIEAS
ncbi:Nmad3 family putative nucleotide modification protein [Pelagerythrobacter rhizovicinus]|uniref:Nucleotide modification associated domain-containing protein n=1 Tax=Pelagerythrobacter rhizovicinus TaxID=2268576 RepID=A0A4Q2KJ63_9SPHN|nr:hypothetical protein [Pelagerythrobacter rhizovicinus]RXZ64347.1 hypothetical protein ETX26_10620 [Pelagerythrobacter rhizovicinus]